MDEIKTAEAARKAAGMMAKAPTERKNLALQHMAEMLVEGKESLLAANVQDMEAAKAGGASENILNRLKFGAAKIEWRIKSLKKIQELPDPVGQAVSCRRTPIGLEVKRVRTPLGVILMIYEARPHVTVNAGAFCLKSGNAAILRGGSNARRCNELLGRMWRESLSRAGLPLDAIQVISGSHGEISELLQLDQLIDLVIPRGGKELIESVSEKSRIPVVKHFSGICHVYVDESADIAQAIAIALDSKCLMPEVCNAMETLLVAEKASQHLPQIAHAFRKWNVAIKGCERTRKLIPDAEPATEDDWRTEYLDNIVSIRIVDDVDQAVEHINKFGSHHTDSIVTDSHSRARKFIEEIDSGVVLVNASTMFCDGESLGMGAEIGISTNKIHARGPMGLEELTSCKFVIQGQGHIMGEQFRDSN